MKPVYMLPKEATQFVSNEKYEMVRVIGVGTFGSVFMVKNNNGEFLALKKVKQDYNFKNRELEIICKISHPNCLKYIDHYITEEGPNSSTFLHLITRLFPKTLNQLSISSTNDLVFYSRLFGYQIFAGLHYLHEKTICHRDIKPSNILIDPNQGFLQICDFGSAKYITDNEFSNSYIATRCYRAPELLLDCQQYSFSIDIWASGCVLAEMFLRNGNCLFNGKNSECVLESIVRIIGIPKLGDLDSFKHNKSLLISGRRKSALRDYLIDDTPEQLIDLLSHIFVWDVNTRWTAKQCMEHPFFDSLFNTDMVMLNGNSLPNYIKKNNK